MAEKLKACPFCGAEPERKFTPELRGFTQPEGFAITCDNRECPIRPKTIWYRTQSESETAWNRRSEAQ